MESPPNDCHSLEQLLAFLKIQADEKSKRRMLFMFNLLDTDEARINFVMRLSNLKREDLPTLNDVGKGVKSLAKSIEMKQKGNEAYGKGNYSSALLFYNQAIASAPYLSSNDAQKLDSERGNALSLAIANRSAALLALKKYELCLSDISFAMAANYPKHLLYKLRVRQMRCYQALGRVSDICDTLQTALESLSLAEDVTEEKKQTFISEITNMTSGASATTYNNTDRETMDPRLKISYGANELLEGFSDCVEVKFTNDMGRGIFATRNIETGDVIAIQEPFSSLLYEDFSFTNCYHCCKMSEILIPCHFCSLAMFCSERCLEISWRRYHSVKCQLLPILRHIKLRDSGARALRTVIAASQEFDSITDYTETVKLFNKTRQKFGDYAYAVKDIEHKKYFQVYEPIMIKMPKNDARAFCDCLLAVFIVFLLEYRTNFFSLKTQNEKDKALTTREKRSFIAHMVMKHIPNPCHGIYSLKLNNVLDASLTMVGRGIYPVALNLINHSCDPNIVSYSSNGNQIVVQAVADIKLGEQIFDSYGPLYPAASREQRRATLLERHLFICHCVACTENWPTLFNLRPTQYTLKCQFCERPLQESQQMAKTKICSNCHQPNDIVKMREEVDSVMNTIQKLNVNDLIIKKRRLDSIICKPCLILIMVQEVLKIRFMHSMRSE